MALKPLSFTSQQSADLLAALEVKLAQIRRAQVRDAAESDMFAVHDRAIARFMALQVLVREHTS